MILPRNPFPPENIYLTLVSGPSSKNLINIVNVCQYIDSHAHLFTPLLTHKNALNHLSLASCLPVKGFFSVFFLLLSLL